VLPHVPDHKRVIYTICEYDPLLGNNSIVTSRAVRFRRTLVSYARSAELPYRPARLHRLEAWSILCSLSCRAGTATPLNGLS
jgi:hypothetical protein